MNNWQPNWQTRLKVAALLLLCAGAASAGMYKWKDAAGVTHFTDTPPPPTAQNVETKSYNTGGPAPELPAELAAAVKANPVTLYTTKSCDGCDRGRDLLRARGIPFHEKTVTSAADQTALKQAGGGEQLPFLLVGSNKMAGFEKSAWDGALTSAAYPANAMLPKNFQQAAAVPAGPRADASETASAARGKGKAAETPTPADENTPAGFRF